MKRRDSDAPAYATASSGPYHRTRGYDGPTDGYDGASSGYDDPSDECEPAKPYDGPRDGYDGPEPAPNDGLPSQTS
jgi:hypothetical protein